MAIAVDLAEVSGAALVDLLNRLDEHVRAMDKIRSGAQAQSAGSVASAALLAFMPVAGVFLGALIGTNPVAVLFHSKLGAVCTAAGLALQMGGLGWTLSLLRVEVSV